MKKICPLLKDECLEHGCNWFTHLTGSSPQTGDPIDKWGCAVEWLPILLVESSKETRHTRGAIESFRNEMVNANNGAARNFPQRNLLEDLTR